MQNQAQYQDACAVDAATQALIEHAQEQGRRGQVVTLEQAEINLRKRVEAWQKMQAAIQPA
jgi:hypothetical protein